jgi:uncharacterized membrane protein YedE/YeeE
MSAVFALVAGLLFGSGLLLSGMADPANVTAFLDLGGAWSPTLAFTMVGAIAVALPAFAVARRRGRSLRGAPITPVQPTRIDPRLIWGSALFGLGWGLTGICPGPGLLLAAQNVPNAAVFLVGLVVGIYAVDSLPARSDTANRQGHADRDGTTSHAVF